MDPRPPNPLFSSHSFSNYLANTEFPPTAFTQYVSGESQNQNVQKKKNQDQPRERNPNWTKREDEALCKAWLRISEDAATGTDQSRATLWERIRNEFNLLLGYETERASISLMHRWSTIQSHINKYSAITRMVERSPASGFSAEDSIGAARDLYYKDHGHYFKWDGCWLLLKDTAKWNNFTQEQEKRQEKKTQRKRQECDDNYTSSHIPSTPATPSFVAASISLDDDISQLQKNYNDLLEAKLRRKHAETRTQLEEGSKRACRARDSDGK